MSMLAAASVTGPVSLFLCDKIEMICNHCLACWTSQSHLFVTIHQSNIMAS
eukprot:TRINITY_DN1361_c0_g1_i1.p3 TRINITY_DN1361_c0_g1~~TRINITY_DN1361_c0_g1_i1.p3  ORF type:complete len:51 (-),score=3.07 TRINITY_DN1361_c0_g1_i1:252-404(-)